MGFPAYLLGLSIPLIGGVALAFFLATMWEQNSQPHQIERSNHPIPKPSSSSYTHKKNDSELCPICFDSMSSGNSQKLKCGHGIHSKCLVELIKLNYTSCPLCRTPMTKKEK